MYILIAICCISLTASAQQATFLEEGSNVTDYPKVDWLKGDSVTKFDKDKIYIVELWATWCMPCIMAMPHLNDLNLQFKDKNVVFIGQNVMEADKDKVAKFVEKKGDGLSYRVAFSGGEGSDFDKKWMRLAGISAIPQTFVIQNNTLVWITHPTKLTKEVLQLLIDGKFTIQAAEALTNKGK